jgi:hypothetical protein
VRHAQTGEQVENSAFLREVSRRIEADRYRDIGLSPHIGIRLRSLRPRTSVTARRSVLLLVMVRGFLSSPKGRREASARSGKETLASLRIDRIS